MFCKKNIWITPFYAKHTFEVDFLITNNSHEILNTIKKEYKQKANIKRIQKLIENEDVAIAGKEVLRLAEKFGKGWFAIMVSENVNNITGIPEYILNAIAFACPNISNDTFRSIARYRLSSLIKHTFEGDENDYTQLLKELNDFETNSKALEFYKEKMLEDVLSKLIKLL